MEDFEVWFCGGYLGVMQQRDVDRLKRRLEAEFHQAVQLVDMDATLGDVQRPFILAEPMRARRAVR